MRNKTIILKIITLLVVGLVGIGVGIGSAYARSLQPYDLEKKMAMPPTVVNQSELPPLDQNRPENTEFALFALG